MSRLGVLCRILAMTVLTLCLGYSRVNAAGFSMDDLRQTFVLNINAGNFLLPVNADGTMATAIISGELTPGSALGKAAAKGAAVVTGGVLGCVGGLIIAGPKGCPPGATIGAGSVATAVNTYNANTGRDPFVADATLARSISIAGVDVTTEVVTVASANVEKTVAMGELGQTSIDFIAPGVFAPSLRDESKAVVSQILGTDTFLLRTPETTLFSVVVYNDPFITGRAVQQSDFLTLDFSKITDQPPGTKFSMDAGFLLVADNFARSPTGVPEPTSILFLCSGLAVLWGAKKKFEK